MKVRDGCLERSRTDLHLTSTGRGHFYQPEQLFPPPNFERSFDNKFPRISRAHSIDLRPDRFCTTTGNVHSGRVQPKEVRYCTYKRAPGLGNMHYTDYIINKLTNEHRRDYGMGDRVSEMKSRYDVKEQFGAVGAHLNPDSLATNSPGGPSPVELANGRHDKRQLTQFNPYLTTTNKDHRSFHTSELRAYPRKDALTFWEMESYPKVWGHGSVDGKNIPQRRIKQNGSMCDFTLSGMEMRSKISKIPAPKSAQPVPNRGYCSLAAASYTLHGAGTPPQLNLTGINPPVPFYQNVHNKNQSNTNNAPSMYTTEYQCTGGNKPITV